jgi:hypothetical protein
MLSSRLALLSVPHTSHTGLPHSSSILQPVRRSRQSCKVGSPLCHAPLTTTTTRCAQQRSGSILPVSGLLSNHARCQSLRHRRSRCIAQQIAVARPTYRQGQSSIRATGCVLRALPGVSAAMSNHARSPCRQDTTAFANATAIRWPSSLLVARHRARVSPPPRKKLTPS